MASDGAVGADAVIVAMSTLVREGPTAPVTDSPSPRSAESTWRLRHVAACVLLTAFAFNCSSGSIASDTKLDLAVRPWAFLGRALSMWDPQGAAGQVQNQAYGYLFPMGPFFGVGQWLQLPMWAVQRLWWSALLCTAFLGVIALARRLGIGSPASRMIAGLAYALSPHLLSVLGPVSAEVLPMCLTPWVLVPLVDGMRGGSPRRSAMRSGVAVLFMGAVNAAAVAAALVPAVLWLLAHRPDRRMRRLAGAWLLAVALATAWWVVPLLLFGHYGVPFLGRIEPAATTTSTTALVETMRGTADWVGYLQSSGWRAASLLLSSPAVIVETVAVVSLGLAGLASRRMPYRGWLVAGLLVGVIAVCAGHVGGTGGLFAESVRHQLDGTLAPLRNVHKFDVVLRLPLVLGLAHFAGRLSFGRAAERRVGRVLVAVLAAGAVAGAATPLLALRIAPAGSFASVPGYWTQAANWLAARPADGRALLVPGSRFGTYLWGRPMDEPLQPLAGSAWDVRNAVPFSTPGHARLLDAIDAELAAGRPSAGLAPALARSGVTYLVVRNDLDQTAAEAPRPVVVHQALAGSPGLRLVRSFGPAVGEDTLLGRVFDQHLQLPYHAVEIWHVAGPAERRVSAAPADSAVQVSGGPESLLPLSAAGLPASQPTILTGDGLHGVHPQRVVLTDGMRRREADFGAGAQDTSATLSPQDPRRTANTDRDLLPFTGLRHETYVRYLGARAIRASSSGSDANAAGGSVRLASPWSAFDGHSGTAWTSNPGTKGVGQWLEIDFPGPRRLHTAVIRLPPGSPATRVRVRTAAGSVSTAVRGGARLALAVPQGVSRFLRVTVTGVQPGHGYGPVAISTLAIPGVHVARTMVMPADLPPGTRVDQVLINSTDDARAGCVFAGTRPLCAVGLARRGEEFTGLDRTFTLPAPGRYRVTGTVVPGAGHATDQLLREAAPPQIVARATSKAVPAALARPQTVVDGDLGTGWIAAADDPTPTLSLHWAHPRTVDTLTLVTDPALAATRPDLVLISSPAGASTVPIGPDGIVRFPAVRTRWLKLTLSSTTGLLGNIAPGGTGPQVLGIGVSEIKIKGLTSTPRTVTDATPVRLPCGAGPPLYVDGVPFPTRLDTTVAAISAQQPVTVRVCAPGPLVLGRGPHRVQFPSTRVWTATGLVLDRTPSPAAAPSNASPAVAVRSWGATDRTVAIGARSTPTLLTVHENTNAGWQATLEGARLRSLVVDGWEQGYLVPAGAAGVVHLHYAPQTWFRTALLGGPVAALVLLVGAVWPPRRTSPLEIPPARPWRPGGRGGPALAGLALVAALLVTGPAGAAVWLAVAAIALAGRAGAHRFAALRHLLPVLAAASYALAGVILATRHWGSGAYAGGSAAVQLLCVAALVATAWMPQQPAARPAPPAPLAPRPAPQGAGEPGQAGATS
ncbi:MAG TPA: alpha-(1-_3)-arabinofuranosyltransferase family protein [Jatrophihabitans sp.]|nr:alpha-(1->3)-arabinofuranosyltransferase family protein [Jatrophihabitans sp.]